MGLVTNKKITVGARRSAGERCVFVTKYSLIVTGVIQIMIHLLHDSPLTQTGGTADTENIYMQHQTHRCLFHLHFILALVILEFL